MDSADRNTLERLEPAAVGGEWIRAARTLLGWTADEAGRRCGVGRMSIVRFESGIDTVTPRTVRDIVRGFEENGILFIRSEHGTGILRREV